MTRWQKERLKVLHRTVAKDFKWIGVYEDDEKFIATIVITRNPVGGWDIRVYQPWSGDPSKIMGMEEETKK